MARVIKPIRVAAWILGGILALVVLLIALLHTPPARRYALRQVVAILEKQGVTFKAGDVDYNLLALSATLNELVVQSPTAEDLPPVLQAQRVAVNLSLRKLLQGEYVVENASVVDPRVHIVIEKDGRTNIPELKKKEESQTKTEWLVDELAINQGTVRLEDRGRQIDAFLPIEKLTMDGNPLTGNHDIVLNTRQGGQVAMEGRTLPIRDLNADVLLKEDSVDLRRVTAALGESTVTLTGSVNNFETPQLDIKAESSLSLAQLAEFGGVKQTAQGTVRIDATATGTIEQLQATARLNGENLTLDQFKGINLQAEAAYDAGASRANVRSLNVTSPLGTVRGTANVALKDAAGQSTANITARGVDLFSLTRTFRAPVRVASRASADVEASWPGMQYEKADGRATVRLNATRSDAAKDVVPVSGALNARAQGNRITVGVQNLQTAGTNTSGTVVLTDRRTLDGQLRLASDSLSSTLSQAEAFLGRNITDTPLEGAAVVTADLGGTLQNPLIGTQIQAPELQVGQLKGVNINANATYSTNQVALRNVDLNWQGQTLNASGTVGLKGSDPAIDLTAKTQNFRIETVLAGLNRQHIPASGSVELNARVTGTTKNPLVDVQLAGADLTAYKEELGTLSAQAQVRGDLVEVTQLRLEQPKPDGTGTLEATATYNLETKDYSLALQSDGLELDTLQLADGTPVRGAIDLTASGQGNVSDPAGQLKFSGEGLAVGDTKIGDVTMAANAAAGKVDVDAAVPAFNLTADANIATKDPYPSTFTVQASGTDLATLPLKTPLPVKGEVSAVVRGSASLADAQKTLEARAEIAELDLEYQGQPIRSEGPLVASYGNQRLTIEQAALAARDSRVRLDGSLPLDPAAGTGEVRLSLNLDLATAVQYVPQEQPILASGTATVDGVIRGTLRSIDPDLTITVRDGYFDTAELNPPVSGVNVEARVQNGALELASASASLGPASLTASGTVPFGILPANLPVELPRKQGPAQFTAELSELNLATLGTLPDEVTGTVSARVEATAARPELEAVEAKLTFPTLQAGYGTLKLEQEGTSTILLSKGVAQVQQFRLTGPETDINISGTATVAGAAKPLDLRIDADTNAAILSAVSDAVRAEGKTALHLTVAGTMNDPRPTGYLQLADGSFSMRTPRVGMDALNLRVDLNGNSATISQLNGNLNGGTLSGGGTVTFAKGTIQDSTLAVNADGIYMDFPAGLKTLSNVKLGLKNGPEDTFVLAGQVDIEDGGFTDDLEFGRGALAFLGRSGGVDLTKEPNPLLQRLRFDIGINTLNPIIIQNNLAEAEITANLRLLGTPESPGLSGRLNIEEGSELRLQEREYTVERGVVTFTNERRIEPLMDIVATTTAGGYDITLQITGNPDKTETTLTSNPPLPEPDILAMLLTGKTMDEIRGQEFEVARNQVLSYLTGTVGSRLGRGIAGATGLSTVRIEPNLIATETDPSARLTVGQDITRNLELIYSMDLTNSSDQIYVAEYDLTRRFTTRGVRQSDGSFRFDFRHDLRLGGTPESRRGDKRATRRIGNISVLGERYFDEMKIVDKLDVEKGKQYDFFKVRKGVDRVQEMYTDANLLESRVRLRRQEENGTVNLSLNVAAGPVVDFVFEGISVPKDVRNQVRDIWSGGVFDLQRAEESVEAIRAWLVEEKHLQPKIEYTITNPDEKRKRVVFDIAAGPVFRDVEWVFEGAKGLESDRLRDVIRKQDLAKDVYVSPSRVTDLLEAYYREQGYLDASVDSPRYELDAQNGTGRVVFPVDEGPLYRVGNVDFEGNSVLSDADLTEVVPLPKGEPYRPVLPQNATDRLRQAYWDIGFNDVETEFTIRRNPETATVDLAFRIAENRQDVVREIIVEGTDHTSKNLVITQVRMEPGDIVTLDRLAESRRNLYGTGAYSLVEIQREEIGSGDAPNGQTRARSAEPMEKPVRLTVRVKEIQPFELRYGAFVDTERGPGGIVDFSNHNMLGSARVLGFRGRYDSQIREGRIYFSQPLLLRFPLETIASPYVRYERNPATSTTDAFNVDRIGFSVQQQARWSDKYILNYGYRIERTRTYDPSGDDTFDVPLRIGSLTTTLTRETRDEILDATRGSFMSHAFQWSPSLLGSELRFIKYFGQYFRYIPLQPPRVELFTNEVLRPRLVFATGVRVGLAKGFGGQQVPLVERFFAGGSTTLRAFEQNTVGPIDEFDRQPLGGEAMFILNNELRFPLVSIFDGVGFVDIGNVYSRVSDFSFGDLRKAVGAGLRVRTPWFILRADYGIKVDIRPGEPRGRFFFSIGQAF